MKCEVCKKEIQQTFLKKIVGTHIKDSKGKKHLVCSACQARFGNDKKKLLTSL